MAEQSISPNQLELALDRQYSQITDYINEQSIKILTQMRVDRAESLLRDESLLKRIESVESRIAHMETVQVQHTEMLNDLTRIVIEHSRLLKAIATALDIKDV